MDPMRARTLARIGYLGLAAADTLLAGSSTPRARRLRHVTKPLLMPTLAASLTQSFGSNHPTLKRSTVVAHAFSWGGDVALLGGGERSFLTGVGSFFAGHVAYIGGFTSARETVLATPRTGPKIAAASWLALAPIMATAAGRKDPRFQAPIAAYSAVLASMFAASTRLDHSIPAATRRKIVAGTSLFLLSDSLLGLQKFLLDQPVPALESSVMATYTAGQLLISDGVAEAARTESRGGHHIQ
jgi:uncharacterized membrane protein YhhN